MFSRRPSIADGHGVFRATRPLGFATGIFFVFALLLSVGCGRQEAATPTVQSSATKESVPIDPAALYANRCAQCHRGGVPRAPHEVTFQMMGSAQILAAMADGPMSQQAADLGHDERVALANFLSGRQAVAPPPPLKCEGTAAEFNRSARLKIEGWGLTLAGTRFIPDEVASLKASAVPRLALKWAFAYPAATRARSQPVVAAGAVFVGSQDGSVFSLDLKTGCMRWRFQADAEVRTAVSISDWSQGAKALAYFGDFAGSIYAVDAWDGTLVWQVQADDHPDVTITGSPRLYGNRVYVPLSSSEWASAADPEYSCCTFRGGVVALDANTGEQLWKTYSIAEEPRPIGESSAAGVQRYAPAGAPVWNSPSIDAIRNRLYVGTGEAYTSPAASTSDAVLAMDLDDGELLWSYQATTGDAWNMACFLGGGPNCPAEDGPDWDIGAPPVLVSRPQGEDILLVGQKSGVVHALDPEHGGKLLWRKKIGRGGYAGGVHWGMAATGEVLFAPNADTDFIGRWPGERKPGLFALDVETGETRWFTAAPDVCEPERRPACDPGLSAAVTAISGVVFAGAFDGHLRAYAADTGEVIWDYDTNRSFITVSGEQAMGGSIESDGPVIADGHVLINSGYLFGGRMPGNVLLAFTANGYNTESRE